ncbi:MAG: hypothetical protein F6J92_40420, partial [Symploca sp. SIO1A3]|nr:hypothetical protein [Symploca sp. SIO1A3]
MTSPGVKIHEFSTGIRAKIGSDGSWVSLGFTGQYMNATMEVPYCVERSIANKEFAVAEGAASDRPAVIGRVVLGNEGKSDWSVVAVVSKGWDEKGRSASFYRYFLCEGRDSIWTILAWIKARGLGGVIFNPSQPVSNPHTPPIKSKKSELPAALLSRSASPPILIEPNQQYNWEDIHALAESKASEQPVSWAYNVEALEQPWRFLVIQAASNSAYELLSRAIVNQPKIKTPVIADEQALKSAIKSLMGSATPKQEAVETIVEALANNPITEEYWETLFNSQGAKNALMQKISSPQMVRLLLLRALVLPDTFPEYLDWLQLEANLKKRGINQQLQVALEFQANAKYLFGQDSLIKEQVQERFLRFLNKSTSQVKLFVQLGNYIQKHLADSSLAQLYYGLAAYREQRNYGKVNEKLFHQAFPAIRGGKAKIFDVEIIKDIPVYEPRGENIVPIKLVIGLVVLSLFLGGILDRLVVSKVLTFGEPKETPQTPAASVASPDNPEPSPSNVAVDPTISQRPEDLDDTQLQTAVDNFPGTIVAINQIIQEVVQDPQLTSVTPVDAARVRKELTQILANDQFPLTEEVVLDPNNTSDTAKQAWIYA